ncbi:magnesium transporter [Pseudoalteromonas piscicida]|uniref:magnesium transporter n=1 Tax=Pseudoalteromonas piscicida TaxID=43662 RepID=UPI0030A7CC32
MSMVQGTLDAATEQLSEEFLSRFPLKSAQLLGTLPAKEAAHLLQQQAQQVSYRLWKYLPPGAAEQIFVQFPLSYQTQFIASLDSHIAVNLLNKQSQEVQQALLAALQTAHPAIAEELSELLVFPDNTAARMMNKKVQAFYGDTSIREVLTQLRRLDNKVPDVIYVLNEQQDLIGETTLNVLVGSASSKTLTQVATPIRVTLNVMDHKDLVVEAFEGHKVRAIPVLDAQQQLVGQIRFFDAYESTKEDLASNMQTMVGASKDEKALSSSWFAVKKRLPWLQINLLTAFAAAAVVGAFEGLIAQVTALAILLPVAAGQSGNAGAQALAVTMRGLTLREISTRHWYQVMLKEMMVGFLNGAAIAITCGIGVYLWSQSLGLALVIALAMISSLVIAGSSGAIVPIALKKFGLDPAQSSSIVLTTITDIAGFMSFLGIALLLSDMLPKG